MFTLVEKIPGKLFKIFEIFENCIMWLLDKFTYQEIGLLLCAALVSGIAVRVIVELERMYYHIRIKQKRKQQILEKYPAIKVSKANTKA